MQILLLSSETENQRVVDCVQMCSSFTKTVPRAIKRKKTSQAVNVGWGVLKLYLHQSHEFGEKPHIHLHSIFVQNQAELKPRVAVMRKRGVEGFISSAALCGMEVYGKFNGSCVRRDNCKMGLVGVLVSLGRVSTRQEDKSDQTCMKHSRSGLSC